MYALIAWYLCLKAASLGRGCWSVPTMDGPLTGRAAARSFPRAAT
eukprot:gene9139-9307_t